MPPHRGLRRLAVLMLGLASIGTWLPTMQADDLAYHLGLPTQLLKHGFYALDPTQQFWALAPWLGDVLQGVAEVLARGEARGAVDALWMLSIAASLWKLSASMHASLRTRWLVIALFASLPTVAALAAGMQTELAASALLVALALAILRSREHSLIWVCTALVAGLAGLAGLKFGQAFAALVMLVWAFARARGRIAWTRMPFAVLLFIALAGSNYFYAWQVSGNPMLPLFNDIFRSTVLAPTQLVDLRWHAGFGVSLPWAITFDTEHYLEAWDGGFGFVLVALAGAWLLAVLRSETRGIALAASATLLLPMMPMQYARYGFPGLVLLLPALLIAADTAIGSRWCARIVIALCALNLAFQANANWLLHVNTVRKLVTTGGRIDEVYRRYAPERALIAVLSARDDSESVVLAMDAHTPFVAELGGRGRNVAHYAPKLETARIAADADASGTRWQQLIRALDAHWLLLHPAHLNDSQRAALGLVGAERVDAIGDAELWSVGGSAGRSEGITMSLLRQGRHFMLIGVLQWLVDWGLMVALSHAGVPVAAANVAGRVSGALLGFWLNGSITFAREGQGLGWRQFGRYVLLWCANTTISTLAIVAINAAFGLRDAWIGKPLVDGLLALGSFLASRHWVYRHD